VEGGGRGRRRKGEGGGVWGGVYGEGKERRDGRRRTQVISWDGYDDGFISCTGRGSSLVQMADGSPLSAPLFPKFNTGVLCPVEKR